MRPLGYAAFAALCVAFTLAASSVEAGTPNQKFRPSIKKPFPGLTQALDQETQGDDAVRALGNDITAVARWHGKSAAEFAHLLRTQHGLRIDRHGRAQFIEEGMVIPANAEQNGMSVNGAEAGTPLLVPEGETFLLHSRPGSSRVIYLDFVGGTVTGTAWNSSYGMNTITAAPFDTDGDPSTFSTAERQAIQYIWNQVAEDYAPFDVDVTTQAPAADAITRSTMDDTAFGTRVRITRDWTAKTTSPCYCGGFAYVGVFDELGDAYKPAWVFFDELGNGYPKYVAEAVSHEAGHNLGLYHEGTSTAGYYTGHGTGPTSWAPIMGAGYYSNVTQWSKGEYPDANNKEDEIAIIQANGAPLRADDHADNMAGATPMQTTNSNGMQLLSGKGVISSSADIDVFQFKAGAGQISLLASPYELAPNLDIALVLYDSNGAIVASASPSNSLPAQIDYTSSAGGTYYLAIKGTGNGDLTTGYTAYGSLGMYSISATAPVADSSAPTAAFNSSVVSGSAPLLVAFDASASSDPSGSALTYQWSFGDGGSASGVSASHTFTAAGVYVVTLKVTDSAGISGTAQKTITVIASESPVANIGASYTSLVAPSKISFSGSGSYDPQGTRLTYLWNFGDGTTSNKVSISKTYNKAGTYHVTLTVKDKAGLTGVAQRDFIITAPAAKTAGIATMGIAFSTRTYHQQQQGMMIVSLQVTDQNGAPLSGATVTGSWSGTIHGNGSAKTNSAGIANIRSPWTSTQGTLAYSVNGISRSGYKYDAARNSQSSVSYTWN